MPSFQLRFESKITSTSTDSFGFKGTNTYTTKQHIFTFTIKKPWPLLQPVFWHDLCTIFFDPKLILGKAKEDGGGQISGYSEEEAKEDEDEDDEGSHLKAKAKVAIATFTMPRHHKSNRSDKENR